MAANKRKKGKFEADLEKTYHQVAGKPKKSPKKVFSTILIILVVLCFVTAGGLGVYLYFFSGVTPGLILNNVSVLGINIGGMSKDDATAALQSAFDNEYCQNTMVVTMFDQKLEISGQDAGLKLDAAQAVERAYDLGRTGNQANRKLEQMQALAGTLKVDAAPFLTMDTAAVRQALEELSSRFPAEAVDGTWELTGEKPDLTAENMPEELQELVVFSGTPGYEADVDDMLELVTQAYLEAKFSVTYTCKILEPKTVDLSAVYEELCTEPVEPEMDPETFEVVTHAYGYVFDLEHAQALQSQTPTGDTFQVPFQSIAPASTKKALEGLLFRDVLGTYTAYSASDPENRDVNLRLSCNAINGIVLLPGEIFSYNPALGKRTPEAGWKQADGYVGSETVKEYGGGICQASSCLYLSATWRSLSVLTTASSPLTCLTVWMLPSAGADRNSALRTPQNIPYA